MFADIHSYVQLRQSLKEGPYGPPIGPVDVGVPDWQPGIGSYAWYGTQPTQNGGDPLTVGSATG